MCGSSLVCSWSVGLEFCTVFVLRAYWLCSKIGIRRSELTVWVSDWSSICLLWAENWCFSYFSFWRKRNSKNPYTSECLFFPFFPSLSCKLFMSFNLGGSRDLVWIWNEVIMFWNCLLFCVGSGYLITEEWEKKKRNKERRNVSISYIRVFFFFSCILQLRCEYQNCCGLFALYCLHDWYFDGWVLYQVQLLCQLSERIDRTRCKQLWYFEEASLWFFLNYFLISYYLKR